MELVENLKLLLYEMAFVLHSWGKSSDLILSFIK